MANIEDNITIEKYLKALVVMNSTLGKLDVLRLHLKTMYQDEMSNAIIESIIKELSEVSGVNYKTINVEIPRREPVVYNTTYPKPPSPLVVEILEGEQESNSFTQPLNNNNLYANANLQAQNIVNKVQTKQQKPKTKAKEIKKSLGIQVEENTNRLFYNFVNSNTLDFMTYDKSDKKMTLTFAQNGRTYEYYNLPIYMFQNLANLDENGQSAGSYFQQNIARNKEIRYKEITDNMLIG